MVDSIDRIKANSISVCITQAALKKAQLFASFQPSEEKKQQVYCNTLAVCAVNEYMQMMQIPTDLQGSESWNKAVCLAANVADLMLPGLGHLECRAVTPECLHSSTTPLCYIPLEVPEDRIGIVIVSLEPEQQKATLLGFRQTVKTTELAINQLQTIEDLLEYLESLSLSPVHSKAPIVTRLSQWLEKQFEMGWQSVESVLDTQTGELAWNFREAVTKVAQAKAIDLGSQLMVQSVLLIVEVTQISDEQMKILVGVRPSSGQTYLPAQLELAVLDEGGATTMVAGGESANKNIELRFSGRPEEEFSVKIKLGDVSVIENFVI